jgi:hypothetical protein
MLFFVVGVHSFKRYLLESTRISRCWIYLRCLPFAAWVLNVLFVQFVRMSM